MMKLWSKRKLLTKGAYMPGFVLVESSTSGTYGVTAEQSGLYEITLVGGGGGSFASNYSGNINYCGAGASGGILVVRYNLNYGDELSVYVGTGGMGVVQESSVFNPTILLNPNGYSQFKRNGTNYCTAGQGRGSNNSNSTAIVNVLSVSTYQTISNVQGYGGPFTTQSNRSVTGGKSTYDGTPTGYGAGADSNNTTKPVNDGISGFAKIVFIRGV
jgi:hypothetical protein